MSRPVLSDFVSRIATLKTPRSWINPRAWALIVGLFLAAQLGLALHQASHHLRPDVISTTDDCVLCQVSAGIGTGPGAPLLVLPVFVLLAVVTTQPQPAPRTVRIRRPFQSRAPPLSSRI